MCDGAFLRRGPGCVAATTSAAFIIAWLAPAARAGIGATNYWPDWLAPAVPVWDVPRVLILGYNGDGILTVDEGSQVLSDGGWLANATYDGTVSTTGGGSRWHNRQELRVVQYESFFTPGGRATIIIEAGSSVGSDLHVFLAENRESEVTVVIDGMNSSLYGEFVSVGEQGMATVTATNGGKILTTQGGRIGNGPATVTSTVTLVGPGSGWAAGNSMTVGRGRGELHILDGALVSAPGMRIGSPFQIDVTHPAPRGDVVVQGAGSALDIVGGPLIVGDTGNDFLPTQATLTLRNGATASSLTGIIARLNGAEATAVVEGADSHWQISNSLLVGLSGDIFDGGVGTLTIRDGGKVSVGGTVQMASEYGLGTINLQPAGTLVAGLLNLNTGVFNFAGGTLKAVTITGPLHNINGVLSPGASPAIATVDSYTQGPDGTLEIELAGPTAGAQYDRLVVGGMLDLAGTLRVELLNDYVPSVGQTFDILDWQQRAGGFDTVILPDLPAGTGWDTTALVSAGELTVTGQPACPCEFDQNTAQIDVLDLLAYLAAWFASDVAAEFDGSPGVDVLDLLMFLQCWFEATGGGGC